MLLSKLITFNRNEDTPVYRQVAEQLSMAIQRGYLEEGKKLPGTRKLALELGLHRNTITASFELLEAQGWIEVRANQGSFVCLKSEHPFQPKILGITDKAF